MSCHPCKEWQPFELALGRGIPTDTLIPVTVITKCTRSSSADLVDAGGVEVVNAVEVSVNWNSLDVVTWVSRTESPESDTF
jgi:hypothetical protein